MSRSGDRYTVETILEKRRGARNLVEYLVQWKGFAREEATWETRKQLIEDGVGELIKAYEREHRTPASTPQRRTPSRTPQNSERRTPARGRTSERKASGRRQPRAASSSPMMSDADEAARARGAKDEADDDSDAEKVAKALDASDNDESGGEDAAEGRSEQEGADEAPADMPPTFQDASDAVNTEGLLLLGVTVLGVLAHFLVLMMEAGGLATHDSARQALGYLRVTTQLLPSFSALYMVLSLRGHSDPYPKWLSVGLVWALATEVLRVLRASDDAEYAALAGRAAQCGVAIASLAISIAFSATDGKEAPGWGLQAAAAPTLVAAIAYARADVLLPWLQSKGESEQLVLGAFAALFALLLWRSVARLGLGAVSAVSRNSVPQWFGVMGAVSYVAWEGIELLREHGLQLVQRKVEMHEDTVTDNTAQHVHLVEWTPEMSLFVLHAIAMVGLALSAVLARRRRSD